MPNGKPLENKVAVVTGAGQGNGRAIALRLASDGAAVFGTDLRSDLLGELKNAGRESGLAARHGRLRRLQRGRCGQAGCRRGRVVRQARRHGEQRRRYLDHAVPGRYRGYLGPHHGPEPERPLLPHAGRGQADDRAAERRHHQPGLHSRDRPRHHAGAPVRGEQGSGDQPDQVGRIQGRHARRQGERRGSRA